MCIGSGKMPGGEMGVKEWAVACRAAWVVWASRSLQGGVGGVWVHGASRGACPPMLLDAVASVGLLQSASKKATNHNRAAPISVYHQCTSGVPLRETTGEGASRVTCYLLTYLLTTAFRDQWRGNSPHLSPHSLRSNLEVPPSFSYFITLHTPT